MKIALYVEDGLEQVVLTPQSDTEAAILDKIHDGTREMSLARGSFYVCNGGWVRTSPSTAAWQGTFASRDTSDKSTLIILRRKDEAPEAPHDQA